MARPSKQLTVKYKGWTRTKIDPGKHKISPEKVPKIRMNERENVFHPINKHNEEYVLYST